MMLLIGLALFLHPGCFCLAITYTDSYTVHAFNLATSLIFSLEFSHLFDYKINAHKYLAMAIAI